MLMVDITEKAGAMIGKNVTLEDVEELGREFIEGVANILVLILFFTLAGFFLELIRVYRELKSPLGDTFLFWVSRYYYPGEA